MKMTSRIRPDPDLPKTAYSRDFKKITWKENGDDYVIPAPVSQGSSLGRYVFGSVLSYNKAPPRLPGLAY